MEYPFKDLMPQDEVTARDGYYKDWSHIDADTFHQISELVRFIREKGYGADTREAIAQALERVYHDAAKSGNANMEVSMARKHFKDLASRLDASDQKVDSNTAQLAQTQLQKIDKDGAGQVTWGNISQYAKEQILGETPPAVVGRDSVGSDNVIDNSIQGRHIKDEVITGSKTTFAKDNTVPIVRVNGYVAGSPIELRTFLYGGNAESFIANVTPGETYTFYRRGGDRFRLTTFSNYPTEGDSPNRYVIMQDGLDVFTFTALENEKYAVLYVSADAESASAEIVTLYKGGAVDNSVEINLKNDSISGSKLINGTITPNKTTFAKSNNLFDGTYIHGHIAGPSYAVGSFNVTQNDLSAFVEIEGGETYTISRSSESVNNRFRIGTTSVEPEHGTDVYIRAIVDGSFTHTVKTDINDRFLVVTVAYEDNVAPVELKIEKGEVATPYDAVSINLLNEPTTTTTTEKKYFISDKPSGTYSTYVTDFNPNVNRNYDTLISIYDNIVSDFPEYGSKTFLNNEESGLPLYAYRFSPLKPYNGLEYLKILLVVTHGHEVQATYGVAHFINDLARNWEDDEILKMIRNNVELIVVPQCNPYGFNLGQRPNYNGVDIARNYEHGWTFNDNPQAGYGTHGPNPLSEIANQEVNKLLLANKDAFVIDVHNYGADPFAEGSTQPLMWMKGSSLDSTNVANAHINQMAVKARLDGYVPKDIPLGNLFPITQSPYGSLIDQVKHHKLHGVILEQMNALGGSMNSSHITKFNIESVGNIVSTVARYFG